jgi:putative glutamine amidotransferase
MTAQRPVVGISTYREPASWGSWQQVPADLLPAGYVDAVRAGGGIPVLLPPDPDPDRALAAAQRLDALVIAGGPDVDPAGYRQPAGPHTTAWQADRDAAEMALLDAAAARSMPTLGICRGMQVMSVQAKGTLLQHVPDVVGHQGHSPGPGEYGPVRVRTVPGTRLADLLGPAVTVPCHHHQAVAGHPGMIAAAHAEDGLLEAIEDPDRPFWVGVQWHPEAGADMRLFTGLVAAVRG